MHFLTNSNLFPKKNHPKTQKSNIDPEINNKIKESIKCLQMDFPDLSVEIDRFPSGSIMIDIHRNERFFVLAYSPKQGFGVDEVKEHDYFDSGYGFVTQNLEVAFEQLRKIIAS